MIGGLIEDEEITLISWCIYENDDMEVKRVLSVWVWRCK